MPSIFLKQDHRIGALLESIKKTVKVLIYTGAVKMSASISVKKFECTAKCSRR